MVYMVIPGPAVILARLAASVSRLDRTPAAVAVQFDEHLDRELTVREAQQRPALEAIAAALGSAL